MKKLIVAIVMVLAGLVLASPAGAITPDEWGMDDGIGVGERVAGTPCLASESHQWAETG